MRRASERRSSNPAQSAFYGGLFEALFASGSKAEAQTTMQAFLARSPDDADMLNTLAWSLATAADEKMRDMEQAIRLAQRSTEIKASDAAFNTLGVALYYGGDF